MELKPYQVDMLRQVVRNELRIVNIDLETLNVERRYCWNRSDKARPEETRTWFEALKRYSNAVAKLKKRKAALEQLQRDLRSMQREQNVNADAITLAQAYLVGYADGRDFEKVNGKVTTM